jgi:hypothetical protein
MRPGSRAALKPGRVRRHRQARLLAQQCRERVDVGALVRLDVAAQELTLLGGELRARPPLRPRLAETMPKRRPGPLQGAVRRDDTCLEKQCCLLGGPPEDVAEEEHGALSRRQVLDRRDERQLNRLPGHHHRARLLLGRRDVLEQPVGVGLQPRQIRRRQRQHGRIPSRHYVGWHHPPRPGAKDVETRVRRDPVEPRPKRQATVGAEALATPPSAQKGLLNEVLGVLERAEHAVAVHLQLTAVALDDRGERGLLTRFRQLVG